MFGFHDYVSNPRSGRPEAHHTWLAARITTWLGWVGAVISFSGAAFYYAKWQKIDGAVPMFITGVMLVGIAWLQGKALNRKKAELDRATEAYEKMLREPIH